MKNVASWLLLFFMGMFWMFRIAVTLSSQFGGDFGGFIVFDNTLEIALLFFTLVCFILIVKRVILGAVLYLVANCLYFGGYIVQNLFPALGSEGGIDMMVLQNSVVGALGIVLALCIVIDIAVQRINTKHFSDNKTDWYFNNEKYDRKMDERADKNQYRTL
ncbi:MAG: hypothetical protein IJK18_09390 [Clostridia bacterium]|nr:hypothetical protein [Clostridia bacterium]